MFNEERKLQFLSEKGSVAILSQNLRKAFEDAEPMETKYNRDLCEWTSEEILGFYKFLSTSYIQTLVQLHNSLESYANWCLVNGLISDNQNHFTEIKSEALCKCVDLNRLENLIITRERLLDEIKHLPNFCDQFIFLGLFEGIPNKNQCLQNVKLSDLNGNELSLCDGTSRIISDELKHIMHQANDEDAYVSMGKTTMEFPYIYSETIIRQFKAKKGVLQNPTLIVGGRIRRCAAYLGLENLTIKTLMESGRIYYIVKESKKYGINPKEMITNQNYRELHETIYGKIQNHTTYLQTYGVFLRQL